MSAKLWDSRRLQSTMRLSEEELAHRGKRVQQLLRPISQWGAGPAWKLLSVETSKIIIATHDGSPPSSQFRDWRFTIKAKRYHALYFEAWRLETRNRFVLDQAYLNIYRRDGVNEREIICLHCDPSLLPDADHARYKRGPHIHMSVAGFPYDRAHIALQGPDITPVLRSTDSLHSALAWGVEMIRDEIIALIQNEN
jgi:hypothetical protein